LVVFLLIPYCGTCDETRRDRSIVSGWDGTSFKWLPPATWYKTYKMTKFKSICLFVFYRIFILKSLCLHNLKSCVGLNFFCGKKIHLCPSLVLLFFPNCALSRIAEGVGWVTTGSRFTSDGNTDLHPPSFS